MKITNKVLLGFVLLLIAACWVPAHAKGKNDSAPKTESNAKTTKKTAPRTDESNKKAPSQNVPKKVLKGIDSASVIEYAPMGSPLFNKRVLESKGKIISLCDKAIKDYPNAENIYIVYDELLMAAMYRFRMTQDFETYDKRLDVARRMLEITLPTAKKTIRTNRHLAEYCTVEHEILGDGDKPCEDAEKKIRDLLARNAKASKNRLALVLRVRKLAKLCKFGDLTTELTEEIKKCPLDPKTLEKFLRDDICPRPKGKRPASTNPPRGVNR